MIVYDFDGNFDVEVLVVVVCGFSGLEGLDFVKEVICV